MAKYGKKTQELVKESIHKYKAGGIRQLPDGNKRLRLAFLKRGRKATKFPLSLKKKIRLSLEVPLGLC